MRGERGVASRARPPAPGCSRSAFPILLVHIDFQPGWDTTVGSTHAHIVLSDLAVLACLVAALAVAARDGLGRAAARAARPGSRSAPSSPGSCAATVYPLRGSDPYPWHDHVVTAGKYVEYALLAPAAALLSGGARRSAAPPARRRRLERRRVDARRRPVLRLADRRRLAGRLPAAVVPRPPRLRRAVRASRSRSRWPRSRCPRGGSTGGSPWSAGVAGAVGLLVSGSLAGAIGLLAARRGRRRRRPRARRAGPCAILGISVAVLGGVVLFRGGDVKSFLHFAGIGKKEEQLGVESYVQRTMLVYYGWRVFLDHPRRRRRLAGVERRVRVRAAAAARCTESSRTRPRRRSRRRSTPTASRTPTSRRSPTSAWSARALPRRAADAARPRRCCGSCAARPRSALLLPVSWLLVAMGVLTAIGLVAGIPLDALLWIAAGLCAAPPLLASHGAGETRSRISATPHPGWGAVPPPSTGNGTGDLAHVDSHGSVPIPCRSVRRPGAATRRRPTVAVNYDGSPMAKVLVTGGAGFIGSNLVRALLERGDDVRVLDNFSTGNRANLDGLDVEVVEGELRSYERVHNAVRGTEVVYHLGALGSVPRSVQDPLTSSAVNVEGTLNVLLAARDEGVRRVVYSSSSSVYGSQRRRCPAPRGRRARPALALRGREARRRALLHLVLARLRALRERRRPLLQRLRAAAEPVLAVRGRRPAVHHGDRRRPAGDDRRRRRAAARLHLRRERRRRDAPRRRHGRASAAGSSTSRRARPRA